MLSIRSRTLSLTIIPPQHTADEAEVAAAEIADVEEEGVEGIGEVGADGEFALDVDLFVAVGAALLLALVLLKAGEDTGIFEGGGEIVVVLAEGHGDSLHAHTKA